MRSENFDATLGGAIFFGRDAARFRASCCERSSAGLWRHAESVAGLIGPDDPRFPTSAPELIDLDVSDAELTRMLNAPLHTWFPLAGGPTPRAIRLNLPPNGGPIPLVKKLVRAFPRKLFLVDAFRHGPKTGWVPLLRLAECPNVFVTTLGLENNTCWPASAEVNAAIYYLVGEVGAGKLLFASGAELNGYSASAHLQWLESIATLDPEQRQLVEWTNAVELFA